MRRIVRKPRWLGILLLLITLGLSNRACGQHAEASAANPWYVTTIWPHNIGLISVPGPWFASPRAAIDYYHSRIGGVVDIFRENSEQFWEARIACPAGLVSFTIFFEAGDCHCSFGKVFPDGSYAPPGQSLPSLDDFFRAIGGPHCGCQGDVRSLDIAGDPVSVGTGNLYENVVDYTTTGSNPLIFERHYNSLGNTNTVASTLGGNWRSTFDRYLRLQFVNGNPISAIAERPDGQELTFNSNIAGDWRSQSDVSVNLGFSGSVWSLTNENDSVETYISGSSGKAFLTTIRARNGYTQTMHYDGNNNLQSVTDSLGRALQFSYRGTVALGGIAPTNLPAYLLLTVSTPNGLVVTFDYGSSGRNPGVLDRLATVTYSTTPSTTQSYLYESNNLPFSLTGMVDEKNKRFTTWTYDANGRATSSRHAGGVDLTSIAYNQDGTRMVTNALGSVTIYQFTTLQGVPKVKEIDRMATASMPAATNLFTYDVNGYIASSTDWNANLTTRSNDNRGQPVAFNEAVATAQARSTTNTFHPTLHLPMLVVAPGKTTSFGRDGNGNALSITETDTSTGTVPYSTSGHTRTWANTFDATGHHLSAKSPRTDVAATNISTFDTNGFLKSFTDAMGHTTQILSVNGSGLPLLVKDANQVTTALVYDVKDRLQSQAILAASGNATNLFGYDAAGLLTTITMADGSWLYYRYDDAHRLHSVSNALGETITYTLDALGGVKQQDVKSANGAIVKTQKRVFDELGRTLQAIGGAAQVTSFGYDGNANNLWIQDGLTNTTHQVFDALNRLITTTDPLTHSVGYRFDAQDGLISVTDPRLLVTTYIRNGFGQIIQEISPDKGTTMFVLNEVGNRVSETDARGVVTLRTFDKINRVLTESFPGSPSENIVYSYDSTASGNFGIGRLTGYTDESGHTTLIYDERGNVTRILHTVGGHDYVTGFEYDLADHQRTITYPSGDVVNIARDTQGRTRSISFKAFGAASSSLLASNISYEPFGPLASFTYGNGLNRTHSHDLDYRTRNLVTSGGSVNVQNLTMNYDAVNDITNITDNLVAGFSQSFDYDAALRLRAASGNYGFLAYDYDENGNRRLRNFNGIAETNAYSPTANMLQSVKSGASTRNFSYTPAGNTMTDDRATGSPFSFVYGGRNRFETLSQGGTAVAQYAYNAPGQRVVKNVGGVVTHYHYDLAYHLIAETKPDGTMIREYVWMDDMPLAQIESNGAVYYIHTDHLNTPQKMTDSTKAVVWTRNQQPFGEDAPAVASTPAKVTAFKLNTNKRFQLTVKGATNEQCIVQSCTNLSQNVWLPLTTNAGTFTFVDAAASFATKRFYRVVGVATNSVVWQITNNLRFPGQYFDTESGLNYNMMRDYDSTIGRYRQVDPIGLQGGLNGFVYALQNPEHYVDKKGELVGQVIILFTITTILYYEVDAKWHYYADPNTDEELRKTFTEIRAGEDANAKALAALGLGANSRWQPEPDYGLHECPASRPAAGMSRPHLSRRPAKELPELPDWDELPSPPEQTDWRPTFK